MVNGRQNAFHIGGTVDMGQCSLSALLSWRLLVENHHDVELDSSNRFLTRIGTLCAI